MQPVSGYPTVHEDQERALRHLRIHEVYSLHLWHQKCYFSGRAVHFPTLALHQIVPKTNENSNAGVAYVRASFCVLGRWGLMFLSLAWPVVAAASSSVTNQLSRHDSGWHYLHEEVPEVPW